ncbi:DUF3054 domain-containing protein [Natrialba sp. INN-245]|uniref:DUF3054 domain-containing protein n=1 Tax=Natrialba sp. INN-245 TaxID=2690967 RepID=UPI0013117735|nr:DUF3054 domain-containing protein [Natrialba sp. INN-245]MWV41266.1 DUF3054 family protein [Natrialba sp. INN-245]
MITTAERNAGGRPIDRQTIGLAVADVGLLTALVTAGGLTHGLDPIADPLSTLETVVPFVAGWLVVAVIAGLYTADRSSTIRTIRLVAVTWLGGANIGFLLRGSPYFEGGITWPFPLVMTGLGLIVLVGWRLVVVALEST